MKLNLFNFPYSIKRVSPPLRPNKGFLKQAKPAAAQAGAVAFCRANFREPRTNPHFTKSNTLSGPDRSSATFPEIETYLWGQLLNVALR